jgi:ATP-binding cassette subfamily C (CFTR/MRP) protein 1
MSTDVEVICQGVGSLHDMWCSVVEAAIAVWLLQRQLGIACIAPIAISIGKFFHEG